MHSAAVHQTQPVLDAWPAIWNFREVVLAELLLLLVAERTMICGDRLQVILCEPLPQCFLIPFFAQWRSENILRALKSRRVHIFEREIEILRARFRKSG